MGTESPERMQSTPFYKVVIVTWQPIKNRNNYDGCNLAKPHSLFILPSLAAEGNKFAESISASVC
ncbi:hypothetical protein swp_4544 [Shewanella piezotolerans WP3]|uniref:Uncharacterized protein n=1 Tax=Shewanella piezotolerans (strain WP3 / JCM 13877) TaxID=225849 RepID=B8CUJ5_SHEPW|nr:hypothetical protein swp_4544 [Shewanella piezotolerans WP3]